MKQSNYDDSQDDKWDDGTYGASEEHVHKAEVSEELIKQFDNAVSVSKTLIPIRLLDE